MYKNTQEDKYKDLHSLIVRKCREAKEQWINMQCDEIQDLEKKDIK